MKERPILFSGPMIRALLAGQKSQTRRIVKPTMTTPRVPPLTMEPWIINGDWQEDDNGLPCWAGYHPDYPGDAKWFTCPYGGAGDRLWVKETLKRYGSRWIAYDNDTTPTTEAREWTWKQDRLSARFMPRWASRIILEITDVRVERVQEISEDDAQAEGVETKEPHHVTSARYRFGQLWNEINGKKAGCSWEKSPWVWAISFRRIQP